ncbi:MAG: hypothetical protein M3209_02270 [Acidobacteriota bacterium]|nr:hypothetical protein [Acidobacteriota bacterium]
MENTDSSENPAEIPEKDSNREENTADLSALADSETADNLPVESIGSYARIDELLDGEGTEKRGRADTEN